MAQDWSRGQDTPLERLRVSCLQSSPPLRECGRGRRDAEVDHFERAQELLAMRIGEADETNIGQAELIALAQVHALLAICDLLEARRGELPVQ